MAVDLLNSNLGISSVLPQAENVHLPSADDYGSIGSSESLTEVAAYKLSVAPNGFARETAAPFSPRIASDELLRPAVFNNSLNSAMEKLSTIHDADVRRFVREDLQPLAENRELLQAYLNMMVGG